MILSQRQYKRLKSYFRVRDMDPSGYRLLREQWPNLLWLVVRFRTPDVRFLHRLDTGGGMAHCRIVLRLAASPADAEYHWSKEMWLVNRECFDWERVEELVGEYERMKV